MILDLFCRQCQQYCGQKQYCVHCHTEQPPDRRFPLAGAPHWERPLAHAPLGRWHCVAGLGVGHVFVGPDSAGALHTVDLQSGDALWPQPVALPGQCSSQSALLGRWLYLLPRHLPVVVGVDLQTGRVTETAWHAHTTGGLAMLATADGALLAGDRDGRVTRYSPDVSGVLTPTDQVQLPGVTRTPVAALSNTLFACTIQGEVCARRWSAGAAAWPVSVRLPSGGLRAWPFVIDNLLHVVTDTGHYLALHPGDGRPVRPVHRLGARVQEMPFVADGRVLVGTADGRLHGFDAAAGTPLWEPVSVGEGRVTALTASNHLVYAATEAGLLTAVDPVCGARVASVTQPDRRAVALVAAADRLLVAWRTVDDGGAGLTAWPWHLGDWRAAQHWATVHGLPAVAAAYAALCGEEAEAARLWLKANDPRTVHWAGAFWWGLAEDQAAARDFCAAAQQIRSRDPAKAGGLYTRAADCYASLNDQQEAEECRRRAGRMGRFAALSLDPEPFNLGAFEAGYGGKLSVRVVNRGSDRATQVRFHVGGTLAEPVHGELDDLLAEETRFLEIDNLVFAAEGAQTLTLALTYQGAGVGDSFTAARYTVHVAPPPDIDLQDDAGSVIVRLGPDERIPRIRVRGMAGMVKIVRRSGAP